MPYVIEAILIFILDFILIITSLKKLYKMNMINNGTCLVMIRKVLALKGIKLKRSVSGITSTNLH